MRIVLASNNAKKLIELQALLSPLGLQMVTQASLGIDEAEEPFGTFVENALAKARHAAAACGGAAIADDSGLCVDALDGAPGLFSARWAGPAKDFAAAMERVERELERREASDRKAHFVSALVIAWPDGHDELFEGRVHGRLVWPPRGDRGFGYDPMFEPDGTDRTFGELEADEKHGIDWATGRALSHRARAFVKLAAGCLRRPS
jgi:XTP/dITP diphosphohydrolase